MNAAPRRKWWVLSRTLNVNAIAAVLAALEAQFHLLSPHLPEGWQTWALLGLGLVNAWLRTVTWQAVSWTRDRGQYGPPAGYEDTGGRWT